MLYQRLKDLLKTPSELNFTLRYNGSFALGLGLLVSLMVLIIIWPSPLGSFNQKISDSLICGLVAIVVFGLNLSALPPYLPNFFKEEEWTIGRDVIFTTWIFFLIGTVNALLLRYLGWAEFRMDLFLTQQLLTLVLGLPPVTALVLLRNQQLRQEHLKEAAVFNQLLLSGPKASILLKNTLPSSPIIGLPEYSPDADQEQALTIVNDSPKLVEEAEEKLPKINIQGDDNQLVSILPNQLLVLHSEKGTLHLYWVADEVVQYKAIKLQLKKLEALCELYPKDILRCHRFFWVNPLRVEKVEGNARGLQLKMPSIPEPVPVSKTYLMDVKDWFKKGIG